MDKSMIQTNSDAAEFSLVAKGRRFLEQGDLSSAVECYEKAFDPESVDESEARSMLIEARAHHLKKHLLEALECFEEALLMGTEVQRRQALEGISEIGAIRSKLGPLTDQIKKALSLNTKEFPARHIALASEEGNTVLISREALEKLPSHLSKAVRITKLPQNLVDQPLPVAAEKCIPYVDAEDVKFILEIIDGLNAAEEIQENS